MSKVFLDKFTLEEIYLIRSCNLRKPDKDRIQRELEGYLELEGMKEVVRGVLEKLEEASADDLEKVWEISLD